MAVPVIMECTLLTELRKDSAMYGQQAAIYIRVSTTQQAEEGYSLEAQEQVLSADVKRRGKVVYKVYRDAGISGVREDRKELNQLLRDAKKGCFTEVIVWTVSRISRTLSYLLKVIEELSKAGVVVRSLSEGFDSNSPLGQFSLTMMGAVAEMQRKSWMEASHIGMEKRAREGRHNGVRMLGYRLVPDAEDPRGGTKMVIEEQEAETVRQVFSLYVEGFGYKAIVNRMNQDGRTGKNGKPFSISTIQTILTNPFYIGKVRFADILTDGIHEPIINQEIWDTVQAKIKMHASPTTNKAGHEYLLSGVLRCPACGSSMVAGKVKARRKDGSYRTNYYYTCSEYLNKGKIACRANSVRANEAEEKVLAWLAEFLSNPFWIKKVWETIAQSQQSQDMPIVSERGQLERKLLEIASEQKKLLLEYEDSHIDKEDFIKEMEGLKTEKQDCETNLSRLQPSKSAALYWTLDDVKSAFGSFRQVLKGATIEKKRQLIRTLIAQISVNDERKVESMELKIPLLTDAGQEFGRINLSM